MEYLIAGLLCLILLIVLVILIIALSAKKGRDYSREFSQVCSRLDDIRLDTHSYSKLQREELANTLDANRRASSEELSRELGEVRRVLNEKLDAIKGTVDEKLTKSLDERLDSNFKQVAESLGKLYASLGELNKLSGGVQNLNRTLANVKSRGIWGEQQLAAIIEQTMTPSQYDTNVITKSGSSERVEFAIKLPSEPDGHGFTYLPIDSKMPSDPYTRLCEADDAESAAAASHELEARIKAEAKTINEKYIDPPNTTDFAVMFLPTESLYAEVLRIRGLSEWCQTTQRVMLAGPTTITALLNSLRVGFANVALNEKSVEVMKLLMAVKSQYQKFAEQISSVQKRLSSAMQSTEELRRRSDIIQKKMSLVGELDGRQSSELLGLDKKEQDENTPCL